MPSKNVVKTYINGGYYHVYNRGVEKRDIFLDDQDYRVFMNYLKLYLSPKEEIIKQIKESYINSDSGIPDKLLSVIGLNNYFERIELLCFSLMPNHFHLMIRQNDLLSMKHFMRSLLTKYVIYFNRKYQRVGPLFQGVYKAKRIDSDEYFIHLSRYIHLNSSPWSSYQVYLGKINLNWLKKEYLSEYFKKYNGFGFDSYQGFVEGYKDIIKPNIDL